MNRILIAAILAVLSGSAMAIDVELSWTAPTERMDNTPLLETDIAQYRIYYGTATNEYNTVINVLRDDISLLVPLNYFNTLPTGYTYYFVVTTIDIDGRESAYSSEVSIIASHENPKPPTGLKTTRVQAGQ